MSRSDLVDIDDVSFLGETEGGAFILMKADGEKVFVPKTLVEHNADGTFTMPEWLGIEKGLI